MWGLLKKFCQKKDGATAIEMSFVIMPLTYFIISIVEVALMFSSSMALEHATSSAARLIRTGQVQQAASAADGEAIFANALCNQISVIADCDDVDYEVIELGAGFAAAGGSAPVFDGTGAFQSQGFDPGGVSDVILIRAVYRYEFKTPVIGAFFTDGPNNTRLMISTVVLQTEPYDFEDGA